MRFEQASEAHVAKESIYMQDLDNTRSCPVENGDVLKSYDFRE